MKKPGFQFARSFAFLAVSMSMVLWSCNVTDRDLGHEPIGSLPGVDGSILDTTSTGWIADSASSNLRIFATPQKVKAGNKDKAKVTVHVTDANHNPLSGKPVRFAASMGTITAADTTDADGIAEAVFSAVPRNGEVRILAGTVIADTVAVVGTAIQLQGLTVKVSPQSSDTGLEAAVPITVTVNDAEGDPVAAAAIKLAGAKESEGVSDGAGRFRTSVRRDEEGLARVRAEALGASDSAVVGFWKTQPASKTRNLLLFATPSRIPASNDSSSLIRAVLFDQNHNPVSGKVVQFSASHGLITPSDTTDGNGVAEAVFKGMAQNVEATIAASYTQGDSLRRATTVVTLVGLQVEVRPQVLEALIGDTVPVTLRVRDASGRLMPDVNLSLKGAIQSSVRTNASGTAAAAVTSSTVRPMTVSVSALGASDSAKVNFLQELPNGSSTSKPAVGNMRIFVDNSKLKASNSDFTTVRVVAFDKFNNPLKDRVVRFSATHGIINAIDTTDDKGEARVTYFSVPFNTDARITASMTVEDSALAVATTVTLTGLEIEVVPNSADALLNRQVPVSIRVIDGAGRPVADASLSINGQADVGRTNGEGIFQTSVTSGSERRVTVLAQSLGHKDSAAVNFWKVLPAKSEPVVTTIRKMRIFSSRAQLRADNSDVATITVILTNENNNPAAGETVRFTSNLGIIGQTAQVDSSGQARVTLRAAPVNGTCRITATAEGRNLTATTEILFSGVTLQLLPDRTELKVGELAVLETFLKDASGNPIGGDQVSFSLSGQAAFDNGNSAFATILNPTGRALVRLTASTAGRVLVRASALNTSDSLELIFSNNTLSLVADTTKLTIGGKDSTLITATYVNGANVPVSGALIRFATNAGELSQDSVFTDGLGKASTRLRSALFTGVATVQANSPTGVAQVKVAYTSAPPRKIKLFVTPDNIGTNGGIATLRAVVTDAEDNMYTGQSVNFRILKGPGGGESISKPVVQTQSGVALSQLESGNLPSPYRGVLVVASFTTDKDTFSVTSELTISGPAHIVTVSRPQDDSVPVPKAGHLDESTFEMFVGAVVQDINGNPVADGTEVHFSALVTGMGVFRRIFEGWTGLATGIGSPGSTIIIENGEDVKPKYGLRILDIPFEDINDNLQFDPGIDLNLDGNPLVLRRGDDRNGDGRMDWNPAVHDEWFDFNRNGVCDPGIGENDTVVVIGAAPLFADLNNNGKRDRSEIVNDVGAAGVCDLPPSGDFPHHFWEYRTYLDDMIFTDNHIAVAVEVSAVTKNGVAKAKVRYPRQFAGRIYLTINAEANGIRDGNGERFLAPIIRE